MTLRLIVTRDQAAKIAYQIGKNVKNKNIALLLTTNTLGDFLLHGMPDVFRDIGADLFPFKNFFGKFARGVVQYGGAVMSSALPEAVEEGAQEAIQQAAQGDNMN